MHIGYGEVANGCGGIVTDEAGYPPHQEAQYSEAAAYTRRTVIRFGNNQSHNNLSLYYAIYLYRRVT